MWRASYFSILSRKLFMSTASQQIQSYFLLMSRMLFATVDRGAFIRFLGGVQE